MPTIRTTRAHRLPTAEARRRVEAIAQVYQESFGMEYTWEDDTLRFRRSGASGHIEVEEDRVRVTIRLSLLLTPLEGRVRAETERLLDHHLS